VGPFHGFGLEDIVAEFAAMVRRVGRRYRLSDADLDEVVQEGSHSPLAG
jgi:hypothetical protein